MNIQLLEKEFIGIGEVKGVQFKQVQCSEFAYIYQRTDTNITYEVFERKNSPVCVDFKNHLYSDTEFKEVYPKSNSFVCAWTFKDLKSAMEMMSKINNLVLNRLI